MNASDTNQPTPWARREGSTDFVRGGGDRVPACGCTGNSKPTERMSVFAGKSPTPDAHPIEDLR